MRRFLFHNFRLVFAIDLWIQQRFTPAGKLALGGLVAASVFGVDTRQTFAYQLFSLLLALLVLAALSSWFSRIQLSGRRELPRFLTVGEAFEYRVTLTNHTHRFQNGLTLLDNIKLNLPNFQQFIHTTHQQVQQRNWFDEYVGYPRWLWLISLNCGMEIKEQPLPPLPPGGQLSINIKVLPLRRGFVQLSGMTFSRPDSFGLFNALHRISQPDRLLILPQRYPIPPLSFKGSRKYQRGGINLAMSVGDAEEFVSLREYRPGDPLRHIHWRSFARLGRPVVKEYQDEFFVRYALILDTFSTLTYDSRFESVVSIAASFSCAPRSHETLLDLMFVGHEAHCFTSGRGLAPVDKLLEILANVSTAPEHSFNSLYNLLKTHLNSLSGCICVLLTWDEERQAFLQWLQQHHVSLMAVVLSESPEQDAAAQAAGVIVLKHDQLAEQLATLKV